MASERGRERVRHFEERANALPTGLPFGPLSLLVLPRSHSGSEATSDKAIAIAKVKGFEIMIHIVPEICRIKLRLKKKQVNALEKGVPHCLCTNSIFLTFFLPSGNRNFFGDNVS